MKPSRRLFYVSLLCCAVAAAGAKADSVKLTAPALGFPDADINKGSTVDPDVPGALFTSPTTGEGSVLNIQRSGLAGPGTGADPLFVTLTAATRMDTVFGLPPAPNDFKAGVLFISKENSALPDGSMEGLGVRAFEVDPTTGLRTMSGGMAMLNIEGSRHVSGGTGPDTYNPASPNGAPHTDEGVLFNYAFPVIGSTIEVLLSDFDPAEIIDLHIERAGDTSIDLAFLGTSDAAMTNLGGSVWNLSFSAGSIGLTAADQVTSFFLSANDDDPANPTGTAEHFYITGMTAVPEPGTLGLMLIGALALLKRRHA